MENTVFVLKITMAVISHPDEYRNVEYSINDLNRTFRITGLDKGAKYTMIVTTYQDMENNITSATKREAELTANTLSETGVDLGDVYTSVNALITVRELTCHSTTLIN